MQYLCPKCGNIMVIVSTCSIPPVSRFECYGCGYISKSNKEHDVYMTLPKELWSDEENKDEIQSN